LNIRLTTNIFGIVLILLPVGLLLTVLTRNGAWFAGAVIIAIESVLLSIVYTIYKQIIRK
jgi:hypothetical protein